MPNALLVKNQSLEPSETPSGQLAEWIFKLSKNGDVVPREKILHFIKSIRNGYEVKEHHLSGYIGKARLYCEHYLGCTLWNVPGVGWRKSTDDETARYLGKCTNITSHWIERTLNLSTIVKRSSMEHAIKEVQTRYLHDLDKMSAGRRKFMESWMSLMKEERKEIKHEQKLIEAAK